MDKKKIVIVSVPYAEPYPIVGPALLASCLNKSDIPALGIDLNAIFIEAFGEKEYFYDLKNFLTLTGITDVKMPRRAFKDVMKFIRRTLLDIKSKHDPEWIGLSVFSYESLTFSMLMAYGIRRWLPDVKIMAGGKGLEVVESGMSKHYHVWDAQGIVDLIVVGDAEYEIIEAVKQDKRGVVQCNPLTAEDLDKIPLIEWGQYDLDIYNKLYNYADTGQLKVAAEYSEPYMTITSSKGCVRKCTFCDVAEFWPKFIFRDPNKVAEEIAHNYKSTGIKNFLFTDNLINGSMPAYRKLNQILASELKGEISYKGYAIFRGKDQMPKSDFKLAADAGCLRWAIGVESGSERVRHDMRKKFTNDDIDWTTNILHEYGIKQSWLFLVGFPSETDEDFQDTLNLLDKYKHLGRSGDILVSVTPTFSLSSNVPVMSDPNLRDYYGVGHNPSHPLMSKFWTSTTNLTNDYPKRSQRFKDFLKHALDLGYSINPAMTYEKSMLEIESLDKLYAEQKTKFISIRKEG
jgi:hypothetical protein